ncbi:hypothetical protein LO763_22425 [Glycomyces sp. A-F 0318]|uniref:hypothetical protein n=1 Tax=Glycomyces amatae TaxID=2881355 RepID=UPI001E479AD5|nr:hypothetical protein [Glycomyces amatae]MCD0446375.1 hypothetical protein [Glycomyces amatae]
MPPFTTLAAGDPTAQSLLLTAIISAVTAAVVALGLEWFAKPTLEARKERILKRHEVFRELVAAAREESWRLEVTVLEYEDVELPELRRNFLSLRARMPRLRNANNQRALKEITEIMMRQVARLEHGETRRESRALQEAEILSVAAALLETPVWRMRRRWKILYDFQVAARIGSCDDQVSFWRWPWWR